jgi:hypothetical protein
MLSKVRGYNDSSGILYNEMNGMRQYASATPMFPVSHNVYPVYKNIENVDAILRTGNDGKTFFNKGGMKKIPDIPNKNLSDGGFKNRVNVKPQSGPSRIKVTQEAKRLAGTAINKLPITPEEKTSEDQKTLNKFNNFIKSLTNKSKPSKDLESRMPSKWY